MIKVMRMRVRMMMLVVTVMMRVLVVILWLKAMKYHPLRGFENALHDE